MGPSPAPPSSFDPLLAAFIERAEAVAARVSVVGSLDEAAAVIAAADPPSTSGRYTVSASLLSTYPALRAALLEKGVAVRVAEEATSGGGGPSQVAAELAGDVGIVQAVAGVAETGSYLSAETTLPARLIGMLSDSVFALLPAEKIVPTLDEVGAILSELGAGGARYLSIVTGPSRTADIERVLTIGVQGPKAMHVIVLLSAQE